MVQNTISSAIMIIAAVIATLVLVTAVYPALSNLVGNMRGATMDTDTRANTALTISDCSFAGPTTLDFWAKNTGKDSIQAGDLSRIRAYYGNDSGSMAYYAATYQIEAPNNGDTALDPGETLKVEITSASLPQNPGVHMVKLVMPNGAVDEYTFTV